MIAVIPGDGIGPEVIEAAADEIRRELECELRFFDLGGKRYLDQGVTLDATDLKLISDCDAVLFGAVGDPAVPDGVLEQGILLRLRKELDLYINLRPFPELGLEIVRENTEGLYSGIGGRSSGSAVEVSMNTASLIGRCARFAFDRASARSGVLTWVHKKNVLTHAGALWEEVLEEVRGEYPDIEVRYEHADAAGYHLIRDPSRFDVILTDNLFGDLLSDVAAGAGDGLGAAASANLHPSASTRPTKCIGLFEPIHGSAPDIAGKGMADNTGAIRAARLLIETIRGEQDR